MTDTVSDTVPLDPSDVFGSRLPLAQKYHDSLATDGSTRGFIGPREVPRLWERHLINCAVVAEVMPQGATLIDVREPHEFATTHLPGAINVPLGAILDGHTPPELENGGVLTCASGVRSAQAVAALNARGIRGVASLRGGMERVAR